MMENWRIMVSLLVVSLCLNVILFSNINLGLGSSSDITAQAVTDIDSAQFQVYTVAVCDSSSQTQQCHDEIYVQCDGVSTKLANIVGDSVEFQPGWEDLQE